ncbi:MAG: hypothetical protein IKU28_05025 [Erysipelotrichaceae bacterium]|nr:hypothetical protein [Erysipelotrichaceae bacterium]
MKQCLLGIMTGMVFGMVLAHQYEDELDDVCYKACRTRKKVMRKMQEFIE